MKILNRKEELDLCLSGIKYQHIGLQCRPADQLHEGHIHLLLEAKRLYPANPIMVKIWCDLHKYYGCLLGNFHDEPREEDFEGMCRFLDKLGVVDYVSKFEWSQVRHFEPDFTKCYVGTILPNYGLDLETNWEQSMVKAYQIVKKEQYDIYHEPYVQKVMWFYTLAAVCGQPNHPIRTVGAKDGWLNAARKHLYTNYSDVEFREISLLTDNNGVPSDYHWQGATAELPKNWMYEEGIIKYKPAFLNGRTFYFKEQMLDNGVLIPISKII